MQTSSTNPAAPSSAPALWWNTPLAAYVMSLELSRYDAATPDIFGYYALQIGLPQHVTLSRSRIPQCWTLDYEPPASIIADPHALPFADGDFDLLAMPHALEFTDDPHELLRQAHRVLRAEGHLLISGFNPFSLFGMRRRLARRSGAPWNSRFISAWRVKDWLSLLGFEIVGGAFAVYAPPFANSATLSKFAWMEKAGDRWWPIGGGVYFLHAVKKVFGMKLVTPVWKRAARRRNWAAAHSRDAMQ